MGADKPPSMPQEDMHSLLDYMARPTVTQGEGLGEETGP